MSTSNNKTLNALTDILLSAVKDKPELQQGLNSLLGTGQPVPTERKLTAKERRDRLKQVSTRLNLREKLKNAS